MSAEERIVFSILGAGVRRTGHLIAIAGLDAELEIEGVEPVPPSALVEFQTSRSLYLGKVEWMGKNAAGYLLHVSLAHTLDLERIASIRKAWQAEPLQK